MEGPFTWCNTGMKCDARSSKARVEEERVEKDEINVGILRERIGIMVFVAAMSG